MIFSSKLRTENIYHLTVIVPELLLVLGEVKGSLRSRCHDLGLPLKNLDLLDDLLLLELLLLLQLLLLRRKLELLLQLLLLQGLLLLLQGLLLLLLLLLLLRNLLPQRLLLLALLLRVLAIAGCGGKRGFCG